MPKRPCSAQIMVANWQHHYNRLNDREREAVDYYVQRHIKACALNHTEPDIPGTIREGLDLFRSGLHEPEPPAPPEAFAPSRTYEQYRSPKFGNGGASLQD